MSLYKKYIDKTLKKKKLVLGVFGGGSVVNGAAI